MRTYNWGILAPGGIARKFASDLKLLPNARLYAVGSRNIDRAKEFAHKFGFENAYGSYEELVRDPHVDIVYIASPHVGHYAFSILCLNNGKAVLCEKPVAMNASQYNIMIATAKKKNLFFMEALWTRFIPSFIKFSQLISEGVVGSIKLIESDFCFKAPYNADGRLFNPGLGGGALLDIGIYPVFMALEVAGLPINTKSIAIKGKTGVDEQCAITFTHSNDILSVLFCSIINSGRTETLVYGDKGYIRLNTMWHIPTTIDLFPDGEEPVHYNFKESGFGYQYEARHVMECLDAKRIESNIFSWKKSLNLINTLDSIRKLSGIHYGKEIEAI
jgi:predicted dehydrogenase